MIDGTRTNGEQKEFKDILVVSVANDGDLKFTSDLDPPRLVFLLETIKKLILDGRATIGERKSPLVL